MQIFQDGEHATVIVLGFFQAETLQNPANVGFESLRANVQPGSDGDVGASLRHQCQHLQFPRCQRVEHAAFAGAAQESSDDGRVHDTLAGRDSGQGVDDHLDVVDAVFEQVAQVLRRVADQAHRPFGFEVLGKDEDADLRMGQPEPVCGADSLVGEAGRHLDVDDDRLRPGEVDLAYQAGGIGSSAGDLASGFAQQPSQALPDQHGVVGDNQPHDASSSGIRAISTVPPWLRSVTDSRPPSASTRSASPRNPDPGQVGAAATVVNDSGYHGSVVDGYRHRRPGRLGVLGDVGEGFGADKVDGALDGWWQPSAVHG